MENFLRNLSHLPHLASPGLTWPHLASPGLTWPFSFAFHQLDWAFMILGRRPATFKLQQRRCFTC